MTGQSLHPEQLARFKAQVLRELRYLSRLTARMDRLGWVATDPVYLAAWSARNAVQELSVQLHYLSCPKGTVG